MEKLLYTPVEVAQSLGVGRSKVYELLYSGALKSVKIGRCRRVTREQLAEFISALDVNPAA